LSAGGRAILFGAAVQWLPGAISIAVAIFVAAVVSHARLSPRGVAALGIAFEVTSCYGIATAELVWLVNRSVQVEFGSRLGLVSC
jgi:hypothetical protein